MTRMKKIGYAVLIAAAAAVIVLAVLQFTGVWKESRYVYVPLTSLVFLIQAYLLKESRKAAVLSLVCAGAVAVFFAVGIITHII